MRKTVLTALTAMIFLSGCVPYPVYKTLQPAAQIAVRDEANGPLPDAEVSLLGYAHPHVFERSRETKRTDNQGAASFSPKQEWKVESMTLHGSEDFFWKWCVRKDGYATYLTVNSSTQEFQRHAVIRLARGQSTPCPTPVR
jgi:hypothetical protein